MYFTKNRTLLVLSLAFKHMLLILEYHLISTPGAHVLLSVFQKQEHCPTFKTLQYAKTKYLLNFIV